MGKMFAFEDLEDSRWQWDVNQRLLLKGVQPGAEVHFASDLDCNPNAERMVAYEEDGDVYVDIPNKFFCQPGLVNVYLYLRDGEAGYTQTRWSFRVKYREKPSNYIYTETEVLNYNKLDERLTTLEQGITDDDIANAVEDYMAEHAVKVELDETLTESGKAADAKAVGEAVAGIEKKISEIGGVSDEQVESAVGKYFDENPPEADIETDDTLMVDPETNVLGVNTAKTVERDNERPVTSGAVFEFAKKAQPDWSVNDETDPAYVKHRTHWVEVKPIEAEYFTAEIVTTMAEEGFGISTVRRDMDPLDEVIVAGKEYTVVCNGETYHLIGNDRWLGNRSLYDAAADDTGEPFYIQTSSVNVIPIRTVDAGPYSFKVTRVEGYEETYHPLAEGYIPETIARMKDVSEALLHIKTDDTLTYDEDGVFRVNTVNSAEQDNTRPITSAAVHTQLGNIEVLLKTI